MATRRGRGCRGGPRTSAGVYTFRVEPPPRLHSFSSTLRGGGLLGGPAGEDLEPRAEAAVSEAREATRGSGIRLATEVAGRALSVATTLLVALGLGVADFGTYAALTGIAVVIAEAGDLGLQGLAVPALIARRFCLRDLLRAKLLLALLLGALAVVLPGLLATLAPVAASVLPFAWRATVLAAGRGGFLLTPLILYFGLAGWSEFLGVALRAAGRRGQKAAVILCLRVSGLLATVLAIAAGARVWGLAWAQTASVVPPFCWGSGCSRAGWGAPSDKQARPARCCGRPHPGSERRAGALEPAYRADRHLHPQGLLGGGAVRRCLEAGRVLERDSRALASGALLADP